MAQSGPTRVVILGGGFGGTHTYKYLHKQVHGMDNVAMSMVNYHNFFLFTPLLHEVATGSLTPGTVTEPLRKVVGCCLNDFYMSEVKKIDLEQRRVMTGDGLLPYDYLVVALGTTTNFFGTPGAEEHAFTLKSLADAVRLKNNFIRAFERASKIADSEERKRLLRFVVIGGGPTGVELAAEMADFFYHTFAKLYGEMLFRDAEIVLLEGGDRLLSVLSNGFSEKALARLQRMGVKVQLNARVEEVQEEAVRLADGTTIETLTPIWVAGVKPHEVPFSSEVARDERGRLLVQETLQLPDHPEVFALGDIAFFRNPGEDVPVPQLAQVATKQAKAVAHNIVALMNGEEPQSYRYRHNGDLLSLGHWNALAKIHKFSFSGWFAWWAWRTIYLSKVLSWPKKFRVAVDWTINIFVPRDVSEL